MQVLIEGRPFMRREDEPRFFVLRLSVGDAGYAAGNRYEVQILNTEGQAADRILFTGQENESELIATGVPLPVFQAAHRQSEGTGDYVASSGQSLPPF